KIRMLFFIVQGKGHRLGAGVCYLSTALANTPESPCSKSVPNGGPCADLTLTNSKSYADDDPRSGVRAMGNPFAATKELLVLGLLRDEPMGLYGLEIVKASNGHLQPGTVYVTLGRLE